MKRRSYLLLISFFFISGIFAQNDWHIGAEYNYLYSTHSTKFRGPAILLDKDLSSKWTLGLGLGYNTCNYHPDNGFDLKDLKLVPLYAMVQYTFCHHKILEPYALFKSGITFMHYDQRLQNGIDTYHTVNQDGWYCYAGGGTRININRELQLYINIGLIGYKMSFNDLDINPHGVAGNIGCRFKL